MYIMQVLAIMIHYFLCTSTLLVYSTCITSQTKNTNHNHNNNNNITQPIMCFDRSRLPNKFLNLSLKPTCITLNSITSGSYNSGIQLHHINVSSNLSLCLCLQIHLSFPPPRRPQEKILLIMFFQYLISFFIDNLRLW